MSTRVAMMKNIEPRAELPMSSAPAGLHNAMPARAHRQPSQPRNLTGLYLGTSGGFAASHRGPASQRSRVRMMPSQRVKTPTERSRYKKVELLRIKEEKRGFSGLPIKRRRPPVPLEQNEVEEPQTVYQPYQGNFCDITRQTARNFTAATNTGITHLEYLSPDPDGGVTNYYPDAFNVSIPDTLAQEVHRVTTADSANRDLQGLADCYKKVCRENVDALQGLLPPWKLPNIKQGDKLYKYTGFAVKSYRKPSEGEINAQFPPPPEPRPRTVLGTTGGGRVPYVPSPYFFKTYSAPRVMSNKYRSHTFSPYDDENKIFAAPGAGSISRSVSRGRQHNSPRINTPLGSDVVHRESCSKNTPVDSPRSQPEQPYAVDIPAQACDEDGDKLTDTLSRQSDAQPITPSNQQLTAVQQTKEDSIDDSNLHNESRLGGENTTGADDNVVDSQLEGAAQNNIVQNTSSGPEKPVNSSNNAAQEMALADVTNGGKVLQKMPSGVDIMIGLEDESGEQKPVEIDETDDALAKDTCSGDESDPGEAVEVTAGRRVSITERVHKQRTSEQKLAGLQEEAEDRKRELVDLLTEHATIVHEVQTLIKEGDSEEDVQSPGSNKENKDSHATVNDAESEQ